jgi:hypothetical protein
MKFDTKPSKVTSLAPHIAQAKRDGVITRLGRAIMYALNGVAPDTWMSPGAIVTPMDAPGTKGRLFDYPVSVNTNQSVRSTESVNFAQLRALAEASDLVRLAIETRKDQITKINWSIKHKDPKKDKEDNPEAEKIRKFFERPDGVTPWNTWLRKFIEEVLVTDALTILPRKTLGGEHAGFELLDGTTIKPLVDETGRRPEAPNAAYQQIMKGTVTANYTADELIYSPRNPRVHKFYGFSPVEQIIFTVNMAIRRAVNQMEYFTEGNIPEAFATLPTEWSGTEIAAFQQYWDTTMEGNQNVKRKVKFVPGGTKLEQTKSDITTDSFDEWLARIICYAFSLPPTQFVKQTTRVTGDVLQEAAEREGLAPLMFWVKSVMDNLIQVYFGKDDLQFVWTEEDAIDPVKMADVIEKYTKNAIMTINEARIKLGLPPVEDGNELMFVTVAGAVSLKFALLEPAPGATPGQAPTPPTAGTHKAPGTPVAVAGPGGAVRQPASAQRGVKNGGNAAKAAQVGELAKHIYSAVAAETDREKAFTHHLAAIFNVLAMSVSKQWREGALTKAEEDDRPPTSEEIEAFVKKVDLGGFSLLWDDYTNVLYITTDDGVKTALARVVADDPGQNIVSLLGRRDPNAVKWATEHAAELLSKDGRSGMLVDATRDMIRKTLIQGLEEGLTRDQLADVLRNSYGFSYTRAELIATTEIRMAEGHGLLFGYKAAGMRYKKWLLSSLEGVCPSCEANADQGFIEIDKAFTGGADAPLQHPACRCDMVATFDPQEN